MTIAYILATLSSEDAENDVWDVVIFSSHHPDVTSNIFGLPIGFSHCVLLGNALLYPGSLDC